MKRIAHYYPWIYLRSGVERMILEVLRRSRHRYTVFTNHLDYEQTFPEFRDVTDLIELKHVSVRRSLGPALAAAITIFQQKLPLAGFDALLVLSEGLGDLITFRNDSLPIVAYCHNLARPVYDATYRASLVAGRPHLRWSLPVFEPPYRVLTRLAWRRYRRVFANSRHTRDEILRNGLCAAKTVEVLNPGVDLARIQRSDGSEPFFLYAGRIKWWKNVELAVQAFLAFRAETANRNWSLVVAGEVDQGSKEYLRRLQELASGDDSIVYRVNPSRDELENLYSRCYALLFPSFNEPWGIVPLEAMAFGKPVVAVNRGGPTESVVDGETGFLVEPNPSAFAARMAWLVQRPADARRMGQAGSDRAQAYSWDAFVGRLDDYLEDGLQA